MRRIEGKEMVMNKVFIKCAFYVLIISLIQAGNGFFGYMEIGRATAQQNDSQQVIGSARDALNGNLSLDERAYRVSSSSARKLISSDTIPRRATSYTMDLVSKDLDANTKKSLPKLLFASHKDPEVIRSLKEGALAMFRDASESAEVKDNGTSFALLLPKGFGIGWVAKDSRAFSYKIRSNSIRVRTIFNDAEEMIEAALEQLADSGLITLAPNESLDVVGVIQHHEFESKVLEDGQLQAINYENSEEGGGTPSSLPTDCRVLFGRRYKGIPIIGPPLAVRLDASGRMVGISKLWRDIAGESTSSLELLESNEIETNRSEVLSSNLPLKRITCGYVEDSPINLRQEAAGVGCNYVYEVAEGRGTLNEEINEWVNIARDRSVPLNGTPINLP